MSEQGLWGEYDKRLPEKLLIFRFMDLENGFILVAVYITCGRGNLEMGSLPIKLLLSSSMIFETLKIQRKLTFDFLDWSVLFIVTIILAKYQ